MGLDEKFKSMIGEQLDIQGKLKPVERGLDTLKKPRKSERAFTVSCGRNSKPTESRIWNDNRQSGGIVKAYCHRPVLSLEITR